ncbi:N-acetyltransferase [Shewanella sp. OPT22]|nr:N-acetyltransferase [Shewanella sp. OPT22]
MNIKKITINELDGLVTLFDQYMVFYKQPSAPDTYREYLNERLKNDDATIFIAYSQNQQPAGFVLNYHSFSSVSLGKIIVLNDLFVSPLYRKQGIAKGLIDSSINLAKSTGAIRVDLSTETNNLPAQSLYEKIGFTKETDYFSYSFVVK